MDGESFYMSNGGMSEAYGKKLFSFLHPNLMFTRLPDSHLHTPPETPLYPLLHTSIPVPSMSYPGFPFPPGTPLHPSHEHVREYHQQYAMAYNLTQHIQFNYEVLETRWVGNSEYGHWNISVRNGTNEIRLENFDHLVVASGNNHVPRVPVWPGQDEWLKNGPEHGLKREILHSIYYRGPERYLNKSILMVGTGASGKDAAFEVSKMVRVERPRLCDISGIDVDS